MSDCLQPHGLQQARLPCLSLLHSFLKLMSIDAIQPSHPLLPPSFALCLSQHQHLFLAFCFRWSKYWSFSISPSSGCSGLISFRIDWFDLLAAQGTLKSLLQHHNSKASFLQSSAFFMFQLSHPYVTTGKSVALICTLVFFSFPFLSSFLHYCIYLSNLPAVSTTWQTQHQVPQVLQ